MRLTTNKPLSLGLISSSLEDWEEVWEEELLREVGMATGWGGDGFHYPVPIPVKKIHPHPHTETQRVSNFCPIPIPIG